MIDYFKLLEVDRDSTDEEIRQKYLKKINDSENKDIYDYVFKKKFYETAYLTLLNKSEKNIHVIKLDYIYKDKTNLESIIHFSDDPDKNKLILQKIESSIFEHLILHNNFSCDESFNKYLFDFNKNYLEEIKQIDKNVVLSTLSIYPFFVLDYEVFQKNWNKSKYLKKISIKL